MNLSGATTACQSGHGSDGNKGVLRIPQSSSVTGASPSDSVVSYPGHLLRESYPSADMQSMHSKAPDDWENLQRIFICSSSFLKLHTHTHTHTHIYIYMYIYIYIRIS